jgi:hypothetical protein
MLGGRRNLIVSAPTNSGKSLIGYLFLLDALRRGKRGLLLEPFRVLAVEKYEELSRHASEISKELGKSFSVRITTGDYALDEERMSAPPPEGAELVVATPERFEMILRNPQFQGWVESFGAVCVDEAHLVSDRKRGATLEFLLTDLKTRRNPPRLLLLSATLGAPAKAQAWLDPCDFAESHVRWPPLRREILSLEEGDEVTRVLSAELSPILANAESAAIVFVYRKTDVQRLAKELEVSLGMPVLPFHADLPLARKERIREDFIAGQCRCLVSTTALGTGVNLPATHLIVRDTTFFPEGRISSTQLSQMLGRAGRGHRAGHAMVILRPQDPWKATELLEALASPHHPEFRSGLVGTCGLRPDPEVDPNPSARLVLSILSRRGDEGISMENLRTFSRALLAGEEMTPVLDQAVRWLSGSNAVLAYRLEGSTDLIPTRLGQACCRSGLPPTVIASLASLLRDILSIESEHRLLPQLGKLDLLLLAELLADRSFVRGRFSGKLEEQVDAWAESMSEKSLLFNHWIRGKKGFSKAAEIFGSLGIGEGGSNPESSRQRGYLYMRAAAILWTRGSGVPWVDIARRWSVDPETIAEEEWRRSRSHLLSGIAEAFDIRCFYFHLKEECGADDQRLQKTKNSLRRLRAHCFNLLGRLKHCSPLGPLLAAMKRAGTKGVGAVTFEKLETAGLASPAAILQLSDERAREIGVDPRRLMILRSYLRRR